MIFRTKGSRRLQQIKNTMLYERIQLVKQHQTIKNVRHSKLSMGINCKIPIVIPW